MENYNQSSRKDENRQSSTTPNQYSNGPGGDMEDDLDDDDMNVTDMDDMDMEDDMDDDISDMDSEDDAEQDSSASRRTGNDFDMRSTF